MLANLTVLEGGGGSDGFTGLLARLSEFLLQDNIITESKIIVACMVSFFITIIFIFCTYSLFGFSVSAVATNH